MFASLSRHLLSGSASRKASNSRRPTQRTPVCRLDVEALEDRCLLATFLVNSVGDEPDSNIADALCDNGAGLCTLRAAIQQANATANISGPDTIAFNFPDTGVHTISPASQLPDITDPAVIDGYTQAGSSANTHGPGLGDNAMLKIELDGHLAGAAGAFDSGNGLRVTSGNSTIRGLSINRFAGEGVILIANGGNTIEGNFIGTDPTGTNAEGNHGDGFAIWAGSHGNTIGGLTAAARNVISGNGQCGFNIENSNDNLIEGNFIGTAASGTAALSTAASFRSGVFIFYGNNNTIGGTTANARNIISGNSAGIGVEIASDHTLAHNKVLGNYIGTDVTGISGLANTQGISDVGGSDIGGLTDIPGTGAGNLISGNTSIGVFAAYGFVKGNLIGTDATGTYAIGNGHEGVAAGAETIGGTTAAARNIVSGNRYSGIFAEHGGNVIQGNYIGTDITGTVAMGNPGGGVYVFDGHNDLIGGTTPEARNVIASNGYREVFVTSSSTHVTVQGNYIGTDKSGNIPLGNPSWGFGVDIWDADNVQLIGNVIGDRLTGVGIEGTGAFNNSVQGNSIGVGADGVTPVSNGIGVGLFGGTHDNTIGGTAPEAGNVIANSLGAGIVLSQYYLAPITTGNAILGNSIYNNGGLGIDINRTDLGQGADGPNPNDLNDTDVGNNNLQNYPVLTAVASGSGSTTIQGTLNSTPNSTFRVEFFSNTTADPSGYGEGEQYLGFKEVTTDSGGNVTFTATLHVQVPAGRAISSTATLLVDDDSNPLTPRVPRDTSEFSQVIQLTVVNIQPPSDGTVVQQPDPCDATKTALVVGGTAGNDQIVIHPGAKPGALTVTINGVSQNFVAPAGAPFGLIVVFGKAGDDDIQVAGSITLPAWLRGGTGDDRLKGGDGHDVLLGEEGDDLLVGGAGRDLLIGGVGADRIVGNGDDDILIAGKTDYDANDAALCAIMNEWTRSDANYTTRVNHLQGSPGGLNGPFLLTDSTVFDDGVVDVLTGSAGQDWFLFNQDGDGGTKDKVTDLSAQEFANDIDFINGP